MLARQQTAHQEPPKTCMTFNDPSSEKNNLQITKIKQTTETTDNEVVKNYYCLVKVSQPLSEERSKAAYESIESVKESTYASRYGLTFETAHSMRTRVSRSSFRETYPALSQSNLNENRSKRPLPSYWVNKKKDVFAIPKTMSPPRDLNDDERENSLKKNEIYERGLGTSIFVNIDAELSFKNCNFLLKRLRFSSWDTVIDFKKIVLKFLHNFQVLKHLTVKNLLVATHKGRESNSLKLCDLDLKTCQVYVGHPLTFCANDAESFRQFARNNSYNKPEKCQNSLFLKIRKQKLSDAGLEISPSLKELQNMELGELAAVENFSIYNSHGSIRFMKPVDLIAVDLTQDVSIAHASVSVYEDLPDGVVKPAKGTKLNVPATVTMHKLFVKKNEKESSKKYFAEYCARNFCQFVSYDEKSGKFVFEVDHF